MSEVLVSFSISPGTGSEAGVGWSFLEAALVRQRTNGETLHLVFDQRDEAAVSAGLAAAGASDRVRLHAVAVPGPVLRHYGDSRSRQSYLAWLPRARAALLRIGGPDVVRVAHQVTFATAVLPGVLSRRAAHRGVWGPLAVPASAVGGSARSARAVGRVSVELAQLSAKHNAESADLLVANNFHTAALLRARGHTVIVEPNIVAERRERADHLVDQGALLLAGHLIPRKRPWLAIQALRDRRLSNMHLDVLGDGVLRPALEALVRQEGLESRVRFLGAVPRAEALERMSTSRLLVHPSAREGSPWVVGEAAASGLAAVVMPGTGSEATVELSGNGGVVAPDLGPGRAHEALTEGVLDGLRRPQATPSTRWSAQRLPGLLDAWYAG